MTERGNINILLDKEGYVTIGYDFDESIELSVIILLYVIQEYQKEFGSIKVPIGDISQWKGIYGSDER